jgi:hypothetical protein
MLVCGRGALRDPRRNGHVYLHPRLGRIGDVLNLSLVIDPLYTRDFLGFRLNSLSREDSALGLGT